MRRLISDAGFNTTFPALAPATARHLHRSGLLFLSIEERVGCCEVLRAPISAAGTTVFISLSACRGYGRRSLMPTWANLSHAGFANSDFQAGP